MPPCSWTASSPAAGDPAGSGSRSSGSPRPPAPNALPPRTRRPGSLAGSPDQRDAVPDGEQYRDDARVVPHPLVELVDDVSLEHAPAAEGVVGRDQPMLGELRQHGLVVAA